MARRVTAAGGFYSFASHGFGQTIGMGVALLIAACYLIFSAGVTGVTAYFANTTINDWIGVDIPVWVFEFGTLAGDDHVRLLPHRADGEDPRRLPLLELVALLTFGICVLFQPADGYVWSALLPWNFFDGDANGATKAFGAATVGVGIFGAFWSWIGFEMAPNYAEESQGPEADHVPGDLHLGHRARRPLHVHLLDARGLVGQERHHRRRHLAVQR